MKSTELVNYIRYLLSNLKANNQHHEFENMVRQLARLRICENILPATGPVAGGGDQGRDFETFRTYLSSTPIATSTFIGRAKDKKIVFTCSLEKGIKGKITRDIKKIIACKEKCDCKVEIDSIYYYCEENFPVGKRHERQKWCRDNYDTHLEIFDGQAISEQLVSLDVFWIAEEYLKVPSALYPTIEHDNETYAEYKQCWLIDDQQPLSYSDFSQIKYGLREATFSSDVKADLSKWIVKMEFFLEENYPNDLKYKAIYQICFAALKGQNNLTAKKDLINDFFSEIDNFQSTAQLGDATALLGYCSGAFLQKHLEINPHILLGWSKDLIKQIEFMLDNELGIGTYCSLLETRGYAASLPFKEGLTPKMNLDEIFYWWNRLLDKVHNAPLFPLENFADSLTKLTEFIGDDIEFIEICNKVDELLSTRTSGRVAAEKCRDRAIAYYKCQRYILAIKQFHKAKIKWFSAETLKASLLAMILLSDCYMRLGLAYAAKYYALCTAYIAFRQDDENIKLFLPRGMFHFALCCYGAGEWLTFIQSVELALLAHHQHDKNPLHIDKHETLKFTFTNTTILRSIINRFNTDLVNIVNENIAKWLIDPELRNELDKLSDAQTKLLETHSLESLWDTAQKDLNGRPFCDVGAVRLVRWKSLGIEWSVKFNNEHLVTSISEEFISTLQIILADLSGIDLCLLPTQVEIFCQVSNISRCCCFQEKPSNSMSIWEVTFTQEWISKPEYLEELRDKILEIAIVILIQCSVLKNELLHRKLDNAFSDGISCRTFTARPYAELYSYFVDQNRFESIDRKKLSPLEIDRDFNIDEHEELKWIDSPGPGYSEIEAKELIISRYENAIKSIRLTLPRLLKEKNFKTIIFNLKKEGMLDWQILQTISNIVANYRFDKLYKNNKLRKNNVLKMKELIFKEESDDDIEVGLDFFTKEVFESRNNVNLLVIAKSWGLEFHKATPDFEAIKKFLDIRYNYSIDDVVHEDIFQTS